MLLYPSALEPGTSAMEVRFRILVARVRIRVRISVRVLGAMWQEGLGRRDRWWYW